jgi:hypothetical protein
MAAATLVYRSEWSIIKPLVYSDDSDNPSVNKLIDDIFRIKMRTKRLVLDNNKLYYQPSDEYKKVVVRIRKTR